MRIAAVLLLTTLAGCLGGNPTESTAESGTATIFHGGTIWTATNERFVEAIAVEGDRIVAAGSVAEMEPLGGTWVDLNGKMLLPGFHDTHNHLLDFVLGDFQGSLLSDDPSQMAPTTFDPVQGTANQQVIGSIHVCHWGIQHAESTIEASAATLAGNLARDSCYLGAGPSADGQEQRMDQAEEIAASFGITSHAQAGFNLADLERLPAGPSLRWNVYLWPEDIPEATSQELATGSMVGDYRIQGVKVYGDGWLGPRTAALHNNYGDRPHNGFQFYEQNELDTLAQAAYSAGLKMTAHAIGDRAVGAILSAYEGVAAGCSEDCNWRPSIEHASIIADGDIRRMVELGVVPSLQMSFPTSDAHWIEGAMGEGVGNAYPWATMVYAGLPLAGSSDWPIEALHPLWGVERAVTRQEVDDSLPAPWHPSEAVELETALRMITVNAAFLELRDHELGTLSPGMLADLVVLDQDLFAIAPSSIADVDVVATMVGGQWVYGAL